LGITIDGFESRRSAADIYPGRVEKDKKIKMN